MARAQRRERLAQSSRGQQSVGGIAVAYQHDVEVAAQLAMLEAVVEQVQLRAELLFRPLTGGIAVFGDNHRHLQLARNQHRFVAKVARRAGGVNLSHALGSPSIAAREHVEGNAALLEQATQQNEKRRFSGAADGEVAHAYHRAVQPSGWDCAVIIKAVTQSTAVP